MKYDMNIIFIVMEIEFDLIMLIKLFMLFVLSYY